MDKGISILVVDDDEQYAKELVSYAKTCGDFFEAEYALNGIEGCHMVMLMRPDIIILDTIMPLLDGIGFLRRLKGCGLQKKPLIIMNSFSQLTNLMGTAAAYGVDYFMIKPQSCRGICETALDLYNSAPHSDVTRAARKDSDELEKNITLFMRGLGVPAHLDGYRYMRSALMLTVKDVTMLTPITKKLYPAIAQIYNTNKGCVERAMRHAIDVSWTRGNKKLLNDIFGYCTENSDMSRPTNSEYIAMASDDLRLRLKHGMPV